MRISLETSILLILAILLSINFFYGGVEATQGVDGNITVRVITYVNFIVFITSILCIKQFFWPGEVIRFAFHVFNIAFVVLFYVLSFTYVLSHKEYYVSYGYTAMKDEAIIRNFALRMDVFSIMFWVACVAVIFNMLYIIRYRGRYLRHD